jgi:hypothetical protein
MRRAGKADVLDGHRLISEVHADIPRLPDDPLLIGVGGHARDVHPPCSDADEEQNEPV